MTAPENTGVIVADLGGTLLRVAVFDGTGEIRHRASSATPRDRPSALVGARGEHRSGAGRGVDAMVYDAVGTSAGAIIDGQLQHRRWSLAELKHIVINSATGATVEGLGSGSMPRRISDRDPRRVVDAARNGDRAMGQQVAQITDALAVGLLGGYASANDASFTDVGPHSIALIEPIPISRADGSIPTIAMIGSPRLRPHTATPARRATHGRLSGRELPARS